MRKLGLILVLLLTVFAARREIEAALLLYHIAQRSPPVERVATPAGDRYGDGKAALVLLPGAAREGKDDPRLVNLAHALARAGWTVLVPDIADMKALQVSAADAEAVAGAARSLPGRVAIAAISYAAAPAVLAALELGDKVGLVLTVGPPYDVTTTVTFFTTGFTRDGTKGEPNAYGKWVFVAANAPRLPDPADRTLLAAIAGRKLADPGAAIDDLRRGLTPQGRAVMALLDNSDPARVPELIAALPPSVSDEMAKLDLSRRDLAPLRGRLLVVHGRDDRIIPWSEGAALAAAGGGELFLPANLAHADLKPGGWADAATLWRVAVRLLEARDRLAAGRG